MTPLPPDLRARILSAAQREPSPPRPQTLQRGAMAVVLGYAAALALFFLFGGAETTLRPAALLVSTALGWSAIAAACTWGAVGRGRSMLGRPSTLLAFLALAAAPLLLAWAVASTALFPGPELQLTPHIHFACFRATLLLALGPFVAFAFVRRGTDPVHPRLTGAALGAAAGTWGSFLIDLHCPASSALHVALGHALPALVLAGVGALLGARVFGVRAR